MVLPPPHWSPASTLSPRTIRVENSFSGFHTVWEGQAAEERKQEKI